MKTLKSYLFTILCMVCGTIVSCSDDTEDNIENREIKDDGKIVVTVNGVSFRMVKVSGGTFQMGVNSEEFLGDYIYESPEHQVTLSDYYIGETEVTQDLWQAVMGSNPSMSSGSGRLPVENVSWNDCQIFISYLNLLTDMQFRLPTEAEWEYAALGGQMSQGYIYSGSNDVGEVAWCYENSGSRTHDVGTKTPNELGIYDMSGNVWEWCQDWYGSYSCSPQTNPAGPSYGSNRVGRGGSSWNVIGVTYRAYSKPQTRDYTCGLRLAL